MLKIINIMAIILAFFLLMEPSNPYQYENKKIEPMKTIKGGNTLYVGGSGPNNYTSIQDAINNASNGDTIFVYSGIYYENIVINKRITLMGNNKENTIIDGEERGYVVKIKCSDVVVRGFTIRNSRKEWDNWWAGMLIKGDNEIIYDCNIRNNLDGILLFSSDSLISNCNISLNEDNGISMGGYNLTIQRCNFYGNKCYGIAVFSSLFDISSKITIKECDISHSTDVKYISSGIGMSGLFIKVERCKIHDNLNGVYGEWIAFSSIKDCQIYGNSGDGIAFSFSAFMNVEGCSLRNNGVSVFLFSSFFNFIHGNNFFDKKARFMDSAFNLWLRNYWKGWFIPVPKPIKGALLTFAWKGRITNISWVEFDWCPRIFPKDRGTTFISPFYFTSNENRNHWLWCNRE